jgi:TRAP transporter T-component
MRVAVLLVAVANAAMVAGCAATRAAIWIPPASAAERAELVRDSRAALRGGDARRALDLAEQALAWNPKLLERARKRDTPWHIFDVATNDDLDALTAYAAAAFDFADAHGMATLLDRQDFIRAAAARAAALDRTADHGTPDRVLASLDASLPLDAGANLLDAYERFQVAIVSSPGYLPTRLALAERWAARVGERALYYSLLEAVAAADPDALPDAAFENRAAQLRARALLGR